MLSFGVGLVSFLGVLIGAIECRANTAIWESNGPRAGIVTIAVAPSDSQVVYAGSTGTDGGKGVFKSADGGRTWISVNHGIKNKRINAIGVDPRNLKIAYAGYEGEGFYKTIDGGDSWVTVNVAPLHHGTSIAIDPVDSDVVYLGTDSGMFKSIDGGKTVVRLKNGQSEVGSVVNIVIDPRDHRCLYISKYDDSVDHSGIWKSSDAGASWIAVNSGLHGGPNRQIGSNRQIDSARIAFALAIDPNDSDVLYAGTLGYGVFKTTDGGGHWQRANEGLHTGMTFGDNVYSLAVDPRHSNTIYAGTAGGGVFKTIDAGTHWVSDSKGLPPQSEHGQMTSIIWGLRIDPATRTIFAANYGDTNGVYSAKMP